MCTCFILFMMTHWIGEFIYLFYHSAWFDCHLYPCLWIFVYVIYNLLLSCCWDFISFLFFLFILFFIFLQDSTHWQWLARFTRKPLFVYQTVYLTLSLFLYIVYFLQFGLIYLSLETQTRMCLHVQVYFFIKTK